MELPPACFFGALERTEYHMTNRRTKILYVASSFGHLASFHQPYMEWFAQRGCTVHAAAGGEPCSLQGVSQYIPLPLEKSMFSPRNFAAAMQLRRLIRKERYALVSLHTSLAAFFARLALLPAGAYRPVVMNTSHGYLFDRDTDRIKRMLLLGAERMTAPVTDWLLTMNRQDQEIAERYGLGKNIIFTRGMGVDLARFAPPSPAEREAARAHLGIRPGEIALVYAAEFSGRKNQSMLIKAMRDLPEHFLLLLPGRGALQEQCRTLAGTIGVRERIRFPGFVHGMEEYYRAADICVSASRIEGLPFNVMEAMACGLPAVVSNIKGHQDLIHDGENGYLYPFGDPAAFAEAVRRLSDEKTRAWMGAAAQQSVQQYGLQTVFPELTGIYQNALQGFR